MVERQVTVITELEELAICHVTAESVPRRLRYSDEATKTVAMPKVAGSARDDDWPTDNCPFELFIESPACGALSFCEFPGVPQNVDPEA
jgi:hypothetical protein